jgi:nucleoside-diphosphate-sugar epimerase
MRLLILGSGGKLGSVLRRCWPGCAGIEPVWHARNKGDLAFDILQDSAALTQAVAQSDAVFVLAGVTLQTTQKPLSLNVDLARAVLEAAQGKPVLLTSSAAVYGTQTGPLAEGISPKPVSAYGIAKTQMETLAVHHPNACCLRIGNVAGADALLGQKRDAFILDQFPDGTVPRRSYIGPHALASVICELVKLSRQGPLPKILNIACPTPVALNDLLRHAGLSWTTTPAPQTAIPSVHLDTARLQGLMQVADGAAAIVADWNRMEQTD